MERDLFSGKLSIEELPHVWDEKYMDYLGVEIEHDSEGVMQDTHWAGGAFGYFPSYALGNLYGGMMLDKIEAEMPDWRDRIAAGSFSEVKNWLVENVHRYGRLYDPAEFIRVITGEDLTVEPFLRYLNDKYSKLYGY
jgi:carboxypeptidase Taq